MSQRGRRAHAHLIEEEKSSPSSSPRGRRPYRRRDPAGHLLPEQVGTPLSVHDYYTADVTGARRRAKHCTCPAPRIPVNDSMRQPGHHVYFTAEETETYSDEMTSRRPTAERGPSPMTAKHELRLSPSAETAPRPAVTPEACG